LRRIIKEEVSRMLGEGPEQAKSESRKLDFDYIESAVRAAKASLELKQDIKTALNQLNALYKELLDYKELQKK